ncbi:MAG: hypothetical protein M3O82_10560 [Verrucomicrobiota bacterium]|nr:hypothetical protein [Verrucomicrobiota bacterium]
MAAGVLTHVITTGYKNDAGTVSSVLKTYTGDAEENVEDVVAVGITNKLYTVAITKTQIVSMCIYSSGAVTIKTNSSSAPTETITLAAGDAKTWATDHAESCPFSANITALYVTNTGSVPATLKMRVLLAV